MEKQLRTRYLFGHTGEGHHLAYCRNCRAIVYCTGEYRYDEAHQVDGNFLWYLDKVVNCCGTPNYHFSNIYLAPFSIPCGKCGGTGKIEE